MLIAHARRGRQKSGKKTSRNYCAKRRKNAKPLNKKKKPTWCKVCEQKKAGIPYEARTHKKCVHIEGCVTEKRIGKKPSAWRAQLPIICAYGARPATPPRPARSTRASRRPAQPS